MNRTIVALLVVGVIALTLMKSGLANADDSLWYRGLFDGVVEINRAGLRGYEYTPERGSLYRLHRPRHFRTTRCWSLGPFRYCETKEVINDADETKKTGEDNNKKVHTLYPLPGQYWYKKPQSYSLTRGRSLPPLLRYDREW